MGSADYWAPGDHNALCFFCGRKYKASQLFMYWSGGWVCKRCWEPRQPQDFAKAVPDLQTPPWTQPDVNQVTSHNAIVDYAIVDIAICDITY